jgi:membrane protein
MSQTAAGRASTGTRRRRRRHGLREELALLRSAPARTSWKEVARQIQDAFVEHSVGVNASAIAFRIVLALVPFALFSIALLGFLNLESVWQQHVAPEIEQHTSAAGFTVIQNTVLHVLGQKEGFWMTIGAALAFWEVSAAIRVAMAALDRVYGVRRSRSTRGRFAVSLALTLPVSLCVLGALASAQLLPLAVSGGGAGLAGDVLGRIAGWGLAFALLAVAIALLIRFGLSTPQPFRLVGIASVLVIVCWAIATAAFGLYATRVASYGSVFGSLALAFVLLTYLYLSSVVFLTGVQIDAFLIRTLHRRER